MRHTFIDRRSAAHWTPDRCVTLQPCVTLHLQNMPVIFFFMYISKQLQKQRLTCKISSFPLSGNFNRLSRFTSSRDAHSTVSAPFYIFFSYTTSKSTSTPKLTSNESSPHSPHNTLPPIKFPLLPSELSQINKINTRPKTTNAQI